MIIQTTPFTHWDFQTGPSLHQPLVDLQCGVAPAVTWAFVLCVQRLGDFSLALSGSVPRPPSRNEGTDLWYSSQLSARCVEVHVLFRWWIRTPQDSELPWGLTSHPWRVACGVWHVACGMWRVLLPAQHLLSSPSSGQRQHPQWHCYQPAFKWMEGSADLCLYPINIQIHLHNKTGTPIKMTEFIMIM